MAPMNWGLRWMNEWLSTQPTVLLNNCADYYAFRLLQPVSSINCCPTNSFHVVNIKCTYLPTYLPRSIDRFVQSARNYQHTTRRISQFPIGHSSHHHKARRKRKSIESRTIDHTVPHHTTGTMRCMAIEPRTGHTSLNSPNTLNRQSWSYK